MNNFTQTLLIACIPSLITGIITCFVTLKNARTEIRKLKEQNAHDIEKLMEQHKVDIDSLREKYRLEAEEKERDHDRKIELLKTEYELKLTQQEKEAENAVKYGMAQELIGGLIGGVVSSSMNNPDIQARISDSMKKAFDKKTDE